MPSRVGVAARRPQRYPRPVGGGSAVRALGAAVLAAVVAAGPSQAGAARPAPGPRTTLIVPPRSMAGITIGDRRSDVEARLGPGRRLGMASHVVRVRYARWGIDEIEYYVSPSGGRAQLLGLVTRDSRYHTRQGIRVGSPLAAVQRAAGMRCYGTVTDCQQGFAPHGPGVIYHLVDGRVRIIALAAFAD